MLELGVRKASLRHCSDSASGNVLVEPFRDCLNCKTGQRTQ